jgi:uncharacterized DUF497 family protein
LFDAKEFDWDEHNVGHVAAHGVTPHEVEEVVRGKNVMFAAPRGQEKRWKVLGQTVGGRYLVVVITIRHSRIRTVTAYPMNKRERGIYGPALEI